MHRSAGPLQALRGPQAVVQHMRLEYKEVTQLISHMQRFMLFLWK